MSSPRQEAIRDILSDDTPEESSGPAPLRPTVDMRSLFGRDVFNLHVMRERLPRDTYRKMEKTIRCRAPMPADIADIVAGAIRDWALERGATHYTHWFQPMTGVTAEKHDAFLAPTGDGHAIQEFSGKMLVCGEPDASSFPSGGIRSTFEARGYTAWDPTVPVFILPGRGGNTLHIPTIFYSWSGESLDRKTPLLRSIEAVSRQALRVLRLFGDHDATHVSPMVGAEQEYFLVDRRLAALRPDLLMTGTTLSGLPSPKGQEMEDHYFGAVPRRVMAFMQDVENRLIALGIPVRTRHNEVAPGQFEMAPLHEEVNIATDHNMLIMNMLRHVAPDHGFVCLLHEKPFAGVNGSGKHNNWSLCSSDGRNLLDPGDTPRTNARFLVFLAAVLRAVHKHAMALRLGTIGAGNDHRLGANEAPPAIISVYLGDLLEETLLSIIGEQPAHARTAPMEIGVSTLPPLPRDYSDRNRTSPFAFTGNKFEFRAVGSSQSIAPANIALNSAVACALDDIATELEAAVEGGKELNDALKDLLPRLFREHMPVVFNGNGYSAEWPEEAARRGLPNLKDTVAALEHYDDPEVMEVFLRNRVLSEPEILARQEILQENYALTVGIEASVLERMLREIVLPVTLRAQSEAARLVAEIRAAKGTPANVGADVGAGAANSLPTNLEERRYAAFRTHNSALMTALDELHTAREQLAGMDDAPARARAARDAVLPLMLRCREQCDALEGMTDDAAWPLPKYAELLWTH